jgi:hypothetical protein
MNLVRDKAGEQGQIVIRSLLRSVHVLIVLIQWVIDNKQSVHASFYLNEYSNVKIL